MRQSELFTKTRRENPAGEIARNAELLIKASFIHKEMAGVYSFLPLGLMVLRKIENIIREEINKIGGREILLTALQNKDSWERTGRWREEISDAWFKTELKGGSKLGLGWTHEEPLVVLMKEYISSYRDLPRYVYQIQTKFRNETRAKGGLLRGREFLMKDLYSFHADEEDRIEFYEKVRVAYQNIFRRAGVGHLTYFTFASGEPFSKWSHEFQTIAPAGEDTIYLDEEKNLAVNKEVFNDQTLTQLNLRREKLKEHRAIEVGNIFPLGTRFSEALGLNYKAENGGERPVVMGSYGIGLGRLLGAVVEVWADDKGLIWPEEITPFRAHLLKINNVKVENEASRLYTELLKKGIDVLYDDRPESTAGEKLADADLLGIPYRVIVSDRSLKEGGIEIKKRTEKKEKIVKFENLIKILSSKHV